MAFAFLFGSAASGRQTAESDTDAGRKRRPVDIEDVDRSFAAEYERQLLADFSEIVRRSRT